MDTGSWLTALAVIVAGAALFYAARAANAAREQTKVQQQLRMDAVQPYVWADLRPSEEHGQFIMLDIGTSGSPSATAPTAFLGSLWSRFAGRRDSESVNSAQAP